MNTIVVLKDWTNSLLIPKHIPCWKMKVPETWKELISFCEEVESKTSDVSFNISDDDIEVTIWNIDHSFKVGTVKFDHYREDSIQMYTDTGFSIEIDILNVWLFIQSLIDRRKINELKERK